MYTGVRNATKKEIAIYNKVEALLTWEELDVIFEELNDAQVFDDLVKNKVNNEQLKAILKAHNITAKELSTWYFVEVE